MLPIGLTTILHPLTVVPLMEAPAGYNRGRAGAQFVPLPVWIGLDKNLTGVAIADLVLVSMARLQVWNEKLPYAAAPYPHGMTATVPAIEIADYADAFCIGRPYCETEARYPIDFMHMSTQKTIGMTVTALAEKMKIEISQLRSIGVRIVGDMFVVVSIAPDQPIMLGQAVRLAPPFEKVASRNTLQWEVAFGNGYLGGIRHEGTHHGQPIFFVSTQDGEWIMVTCFADPV